MTTVIRVNLMVDKKPRILAVEPDAEGYQEGSSKSYAIVTVVPQFLD